MVKSAVEKQNKERLIQDCHITENGTSKRKTKTAHIVDHIEASAYQRAPLKELIKCTKLETKTILLSRFGMLDCGKNFKGTRIINCEECGVYDDEKHRVNYCSKFRSLNNYDSETKVDFGLIYSNDVDILRKIMPKISEVWNIQNANGTMNIE